MSRKSQETIGPNVDIPATTESNAFQHTKRKGGIQMAGMTKPIAPKQQTETRSAVERIGAFAAAVRPEHLTADIRQLFKRNILDSIGCAIAAVAGPSLRPLREQDRKSVV